MAIRFLRIYVLTAAIALNALSTKNPDDALNSSTAMQHSTSEAVATSDDYRFAGDISNYGPGKSSIYLLT